MFHVEQFLRDKEVLAIVLGIVYVLIEFFLGRTTLVKSGSVLELVLNGAKRVLEALGIKKNSQQIK